ncbi:hypothetical protein [Candidatus Tisiphia endosymbiont of Nemotelus uliginosus]|uniref:hypothetical protein n=1 Tax=Candidatus Tisiphia endosymbiont of Nemotelus uliginosus TaxID=3077926 RepID=UPI0035C92F44
MSISGVFGSKIAAVQQEAIIDEDILGNSEVQAKLIDINNNVVVAPNMEVSNDDLPDEYILVDRKELPIGHNISILNFAHKTTDLAYEVPNGHKFARKELNLMGNNLIGTGWQIAFKSSDRPETAQYGYKAVALVNHNTKEVHIASAGTVPSIYDAIDDLCIAVGSTPYKFAPAKATLQRIMHEFSDDYTISTSGHSLGALPSDYMIMLAQLAGRKVGKSTTFDSPGTENAQMKALKEYETANNVKISIEEIEKCRACCEVFVGKPNLINTSNPHFGKVNLALFDRAQEEEIVQTGAWYYTQYLYNKIGTLIVAPCLNYLNLTRIIEEHPLRNFSHEEKFTYFPVKQWGQDGKVVLEYTPKLAGCKSTGKDVVVYDYPNLHSDSADLYSYESIQPKYYAFNDLTCSQQVSLESNLMGHIDLAAISAIC